MPAGFDPRLVVSSGQLGAVLGLTERRVQQLEAESVFTNVGRGRSKRYHLADAVQAYCEKSEADLRRAAQEGTNSRELFEQERARKLKLENDQREALLVETPDAIAAIDRIFGEVRTALASIPARLTDDVTERRRIENEFDAVLSDLATRLDQAGAALQEGRDPLEAGAEDNA